MTNNFLTKSADIRLQITKARIRLIVASGVTGGKSRAQRFRINMKRAVIDGIQAVMSEAKIGKYTGPFLDGASVSICIIHTE